MNDANYVNLETSIREKGFTLIKRVVDHRELSVLHGNFKASSSRNSEAIRWISGPRIPLSLANKLKSIELGCFPTRQMLSVGAFFFRVSTDTGAATVNFPWHVDHEPFYLYGNQRHYLNFWIPIEKKSGEDSNLCLIPFDRLTEVDPELSNQIIGAGAISVSSKRIHFDALGISRNYEFELESIAEVPHVEVGDILVIRGDVLHRTQNQRIERTAMSIRLVDEAQVISAGHYYPTVPGHARGLLAAVQPYAANAFVFDATGKSTMSIKSLLTAARELRSTMPPDQIRRTFDTFKEMYTLRLQSTVCPD